MTGKITFHSNPLVQIITKWPKDIRKSRKVFENNFPSIWQEMIFSIEKHVRYVLRGLCFTGISSYICYLSISFLKLMNTLIWFSNAAIFRIYARSDVSVDYKVQITLHVVYSLQCIILNMFYVLYYLCCPIFWLSIRSFSVLSYVVIVACSCVM